MPTDSKTAGHTPTPWKFVQGQDERDFIVAESTGNTVCETNAELYANGCDPKVRRITVAEAQANAHLICSAVNSHEALREALRESLTWLRGFPTANTSSVTTLAVRKVIDRAEKALALAEEQTK